MRQALHFIVAFALLVGLAGCSAAPAARTSAGPVTQESAPVAPAPAPAAVQGADTATGVGAQNDADRMIVRTVDMSLVVTDAGAAMDAVAKLVRDAGGYVTESNAWREDEQLRGRMTLRVPAAGLDGIQAALHSLSVRVERENTSGQDVTEEYTDLDAQLRNLQATENELRELLSEVRQRTQKAEEILAVHRELTSIRGQIEQVQGRMKYLSNLTDMATMKVEFVPDVLAKPVVEPGWRPLETLKNAGRSTVNALKWAVDALIWIFVYLLPVLIVIALPFVLLFFLIRWLVRRRRSNRPPSVAKPGAPAA